MSINKVLKTSSSTKYVELELRFNITDVDTYKTLLQKITGDVTIEQSINFIDSNEDGNRIYTIPFVNGAKKTPIYSRKKRLVSARRFDNVLPYKIAVSLEMDTSPFAVDVANMARVKLRRSVRPPELPDWRVDFTLVKNMDTPASIKNNVKQFKADMLYPINADTFIDKAPWEAADSLELEIEHIPTGSNKKLQQSSVDDVIKYLLGALGDSHHNAYALQEKVYQIALLMVEKKRQSGFRSRKGLRDLYNKVIELNRSNYFTKVFPNITDFYLLDKADGERTLMLADKDTLSAVGSQVTTIPLDETSTAQTLFDAEFVNGKYYVFDVMVYEGENLMKNDTSVRVSYIDKIVAKYPLCIAKPMIPLTSDYQSQISKMWGGGKGNDNYETDGLIFTPKKGGYKTMKSWKWKPLDHMSIDFLVKRPPNLDGVSPYHKKKGHTMLFLFSGINNQTYNRLRMTPVTKYKEMFPRQGMHQYFPIQFSPSDDPYAYIYYHPDDSKIPLKEVMDNVCEFKRVNLDAEPTWQMMRVRIDRKPDVSKGTYFGNSSFVAEYTWLNWQNPLLFADLIMSSSDYMDMGYFKEEKLAMYKPMTGFNSFVKTNLINRFANASWLVDIMSGKGQDMFRVSNAKIKNALFIDGDSHAISELVSRKHGFQRVKHFNTKVYTKVIDMSTDSAKIIDSVKQLGVPVGGFDIAMCNFAIHYLMNTPSNVRNIVSLVDGMVKHGGSFMFTSFDGEQVFKTLKTKKKWDVKEGDVLKYSIEKKYTSKSLSPVGQKIGVLLPFSGGNMYDEYLVNYKHLFKEFKKKGFVVTESASFSKFLPKFEKESKLYGKMTDGDKQFVSLYRYAILKKKPLKRTKKSKVKDDEQEHVHVEESDTVGGSVSSIYKTTIPPQWYNYIRAGDKHAIVRLNRGMFRAINVGDTLKFRDSGGTGVMDTVISNKKVYHSIDELFDDMVHTRVLPGVVYKAVAVNALKSHYGKDVESVGVVLISLRT
jgi:ASC-1-like (ASCH) protein